MLVLQMKFDLCVFFQACASLKLLKFWILLKDLQLGQNKSKSAPKIILIIIYKVTVDLNLLMQQDKCEKETAVPLPWS